MTTATLAVDHAAGMRAEYEAKRVRQAVRVWEIAIGRVATEAGEARLMARTTAKAAYALLVDRVQEAGRLIVEGDWCYEPTPCGTDVFIWPYF